MASNSSARPSPSVPAETSVFRRLMQAVIVRLWYLHTPVYMTLTLPPSATLAALGKAAKPSTDRLHLGNVFADGRRYYLQAVSAGGFRMTTNAKRSWRYAHRTTAITMMTGNFNRLHDHTQLELQSRMKITYLLDVLWLPTFITSLVVMMPWHNVLIMALVAALYGLSWCGHRYSAALEAYEMLFFIEKALADFVPPLLPQLENEGADVVYDRQRDFVAAWRSFYQDVVHTDPANVSDPHV